MKNLALQKAIKIVGNQSILARQLKISPQRVHEWTKNKLPAQWVIPVENESGVSRTELRPDLYPDETIIK